MRAAGEEERLSSKVSVMILGRTIAKGAGEGNFKSVYAAFSSRQRPTCDNRNAGFAQLEFRLPWVVPDNCARAIKRGSP
jgi:hypothetical protein